MNPRILASGLFFALALAGCQTVLVKGTYDFADHPGKGLVAISTRMDDGDTCPNDNVSGALGFRKVSSPAEGALGPHASVDALILMPPESRAEREDSIVFTMQAPRSERKVPTGAGSHYNDMGNATERIIPAIPPTHFVVQEVEAGHYLLNSLKVFIEGHPGFYKARDLDRFWFTLKEGEVVYLGEIGVHLSRSTCGFEEYGLDSYFSYSVRDEWGRDESQFKATIHNISPDVVQKRLLQRQ